MNHIEHEIAMLRGEIAALNKKNVAFQRQIEALIATQLTVVRAEMMEPQTLELTQIMRSKAIQNLEALKESIARSRG